MGMVLLFFLLAYLALVIVPAGVAVLLLLWRSWRSPDFWASGLFFTVIAILVLPMLRPGIDPPVQSLGPGLANFITVIQSSVSIYLGWAAIGSLLFSLLTFYLKRWHLLKGLVIGICAASWVWLILMFRPA